MKSSRLKPEIRDNASKHHKLVGEILKTKEPFKHYKIYQEYPVNKINPEFKSGREKFDWVVLDLKIVIECHGRQHYEFVELFHHDYKGFIEQQERDFQKKKAVEEVGFTYIEIRYDIDPTLELILASWVPNVIKKKPKSKKEKTTKQLQLIEKQKEYRKAKYKKLKDLKKEKNGTTNRKHT